MIIIAETVSKYNARLGLISHRRAKTNVCNVLEDISAMKGEQKLENSVPKVNILHLVTHKGV